MQQKVKDKWVKALRSGKYKKGKGYLKQTAPSGIVSYCCLGVLCEAVKLPLTETSVAPAYTPNGKDVSYKTHHIEGWSTYNTIPPMYKEQLGLDGKDESCLISMNDGDAPYKKPKSFKEIADWIEKNVPTE